jgi:hypothetical protein
MISCAKEYVEFAMHKIETEKHDSILKNVEICANVKLFSQNSVDHLDWLPWPSKLVC